jgi:hypothetical protein
VLLVLCIEIVFAFYINVFICGTYPDLPDFDTPYSCYSLKIHICIPIKKFLVHRGRDRSLVGFTITYTTNAYHHLS